MRLVQAGPRDAKVILVGEAPGANEEATGVPFSGGAGEVLDGMLSRCGIDRSACFVTNICMTRPPSNDFDWFLSPVKLELVQGLAQLRHDIETIRPNLIIALGAWPLAFLTGRWGIGDWRGSILDCRLVPGVKVIPTYHPAAVLRVWDYKAVAEIDLRRCRDQATFPDIRRRRRHVEIVSDQSRASWLANRLLSARWLGTDIESYKTNTGCGWNVACCGFADSADHAWVIPWDEAWQQDLIREVCESPVPKVLQNGMYDQTVLAEAGVHLTNFAWDTMLAHHSLYPECSSGGDEMATLGKKKRQSPLSKGLDFLTSIYTDIPYYKPAMKAWDKLDFDDGPSRIDPDVQAVLCVTGGEGYTQKRRDFYAYNGLDCCATYEVREQQEPELDDFRTRHVLTHEMSLVEPLLEAQNHGIQIDTALRAQLREQYETDIAVLQATLDLEAGESVNVKSSPQVQRLLYDRLNLPVRRNRKTGQATADKDALVWLAGRYDHPLLRSILAIRQRRDIVERYVNAETGPDGRMRCCFDITGTRSGRLSSREWYDGSGTNLLNLPVRKAWSEGIRRMYVADPGKVFVYRDYKQAEAVSVAYWAHCESMIELFNDPTRDGHREVAAQIFNKPLADVTEGERYLSKRTIHGGHYGLGPEHMAEGINEDAEDTGIRVTSDQCRDLQNKYFMLRPEIKERFWGDVTRELRHNRTLINAFGMKRTFFGRWEDKLLREAYSWKPQSDVGWLGTEAIVACKRAIVPAIPGARFVVNVYDSVMFECYPKDALRVAAVMEQCMAIPLTIDSRTFTIPSDCKVGRNFGARSKKHPEQNPHGLVDLEIWLTENRSAA